MKPPHPNRYRDHWAGDLRAEQVGEARAWRAGCTAVATTAA